MKHRSSHRFGLLLLLALCKASLGVISGTAMLPSPSFTGCGEAAAKLSDETPTIVRAKVSANGLTHVPETKISPVFDSTSDTRVSPPVITKPFDSSGPAHVPDTAITPWMMSGAGTGAQIGMGTASGVAKKRASGDVKQAAALPLDRDAATASHVIVVRADNDGFEVDSGNPLLDLVHPTKPTDLKDFTDAGWKVLKPEFGHGGTGIVSLMMTPGEKARPVVIKADFRDDERMVVEAERLDRLKQVETHFIAEETAKDASKEWIPKELRTRSLFVRGKTITAPGGSGETLLQMEFVPRAPGSLEPAPSLGDRLKDPNDPVLSDPVLQWRITQQMILANARLHQSRIIHRDLKPGNILVDDKGNITIIDFGLAEMDGNRWYGWSDDVASRPGQPARRITSGTPDYMSPEQQNGDQGTPFHDIYSSRKAILMTAGHNQDNTNIQYERPYGVLNGRVVPIKEFQFAPEHLKHLTPEQATALWAPHIKDDKNFDQAVRNSTTMPPAEFRKWFAGQIAELDVPGFRADVGAKTLAGSEILIQDFPNGYTPSKRDALIRSVLRYQELTEDARNVWYMRTGEIGQITFLHYDLFVNRVNALHAEGKVESIETYRKQIENEDR